MGVSFSSGGYISSSSQIADSVILAADILDESITSAKLKGEGTASQVLTSNGTGASPSMQSLPASVLTFVNIDTQTLGSVAAGITFSSIPTGYNAFMLSFNGVGHTDANGDAAIQFNGDTGTNYNRAKLTQISTTITGTNYSGINQIGLSPGTIGNASIFNAFITIQNNNSHQKIVEAATTLNTTATNHTTGFWTDTTEISSIYIYLRTGQWAVGTKATLWGLK